MDKCPKCGVWTLELSMGEGSLKCYNAECDYEKRVDVHNYLREHSDLSRLAKILPLNGYQI